MKPDTPSASRSSNLAHQAPHAARWALISVAGTNAATSALVACMLVSVLVTPIVDRLPLPFAALAFSAVVSLMPGFFLFNAATGFVELVSVGPSAPGALLTSIATNRATAFLIITAMAFGLILPRMLFERVLPAPVSKPHGRSMHRTAVQD